MGILRGIDANEQALDCSSSSKEVFTMLWSATHLQCCWVLLTCQWCPVILAGEHQLHRTAAYPGEIYLCLFVVSSPVLAGMQQSQKQQPQLQAVLANKAPSPADGVV